jgi:hypothetical protein
VKFRRQAAIELGELGDTRGVPSLLRAFKDKDWQVQLNAVKSLAKMDDDHAVQPLITILERGKPRLQQEAAKALGSMVKTRAVEPLIAAYRVSEKGYVRTSIVEALGNLQDVRAFEVFNKALDDRNLGVRMAANEAIKKLCSNPVSTGTSLDEPAPVLRQPASTERSSSSQKQGKRHKMGLPASLRRSVRSILQIQHRKVRLPGFLRRPGRTPLPPRRGKVNRRAIPDQPPASPVQAAYTQVDQPPCSEMPADLPVPAEWCEYEPQDSSIVTSINQPDPSPVQVEHRANPTSQIACACAQPIKSGFLTNSSLHEF